MNAAHAPIRQFRVSAAAAAAALMLSACGGEQPPSAGQNTVVAVSFAQPGKRIDAKPPYIVQEGCKFWLVTDAGTVSTTSERGSGPSGNATLHMGGHRMGLSECKVVDNPRTLAVY